MRYQAVEVCDRDTVVYQAMGHIVNSGQELAAATAAEQLLPKTSVAVASEAQAVGKHPRCWTIAAEL